MGIFEAVVVFICSWWLVFLPTLSAGTRSQYEADAVVPGTERGAPEKPGLVPKLLIATAGAVVITALVGLALSMGWLEFLIPREQR